MEIQNRIVCMFVYIFIRNRSIDGMPNVSDLEASSVVANVNESKFYFEYLFELTY